VLKKVFLKSSLTLLPKRGRKSPPLKGGWRGINNKMLLF
jgi:hypothetical protein